MQTNPMPRDAARWNPVARRGTGPRQIRRAANLCGQRAGPSLLVADGQLVLAGKIHARRVELATFAGWGTTRRRGQCRDGADQEAEQRQKKVATPAMAEVAACAKISTSPPDC